MSYWRCQDGRWNGGKGMLNWSTMTWKRRRYIVSMARHNMWLTPEQMTWRCVVQRYCDTVAAYYIKMEWIIESMINIFSLCC